MLSKIAKTIDRFIFALTLAGCIVLGWQAREQADSWIDTTSNTAFQVLAKELMR